MKLAASQALYAHWSSLCRGRRAPERSDIDPAAIRHVLAQTFLLDVDPDEREGRDLPIRLSGTRLDALFGRDLKGSSFGRLWGETHRRPIREIVTDVLDESLPAVIGGSAGPDGAQPLRFEMLLLPLRHLGRTHARMLGSLAFASTPTWLGLRPVCDLNVTSWRMLDRMGEVGPANSDRRVHLVVHEGGRPRQLSAMPA
jgi:hypothetical protein